MTVFIIQKQMRFDNVTGELVPRFLSIDKAKKFGNFEYLLSPSAHPFRPQNVVGDLHEKLKNYSDKDLLLLIGNPALIGMAVAVASHHNNGKIRLLQWSGKDGEYVEIQARIF